MPHALWVGWPVTSQLKTTTWTNLNIRSIMEDCVARVNKSFWPPPPPFHQNKINWMGAGIAFFSRFFSRRGRRQGGSGVLLKGSITCKKLDIHKRKPICIVPLLPVLRIFLIVQNLLLLHIFYQFETFWKLLSIY